MSKPKNHNFVNHRSVGPGTPKDEPPSSSWWVQPSREAFMAAQAAEAERMARKPLSVVATRTEPGI